MAVLLLSIYSFVCMHAYATRLRCGHVCLRRIDVIHDHISEQLTMIIDD